MVNSRHVYHDRHLFHAHSALWVVALDELLTLALPEVLPAESDEMRNEERHVRTDLGALLADRGRPLEAFRDDLVLNELHRHLLGMLLLMDSPDYIQILISVTTDSEPYEAKE